MILITSAAYCSPALVAEFGKMPPCMLPVQNRRLYEHQLSLMPAGHKMALSLPDSYQLSEYDLSKLNNQGVNIISLSEKLSLGESIAEALEKNRVTNEPLYILHGDTLFSRLEFAPDTYAIANPEDNYSWATANCENKVYSGWFAFSSPDDLLVLLKQCGYDFVQARENYAEQHHVKEIEFAGWLDFGLVNSYYRSCSRLTTQRAFNDLKINRFAVRKCSIDTKKMQAEANWFASIPTELKHYTPALWDSGIKEGKGYYEIEYLYNSTLSNLWVFAENPFGTWKDILSACSKYLDDEFAYKPHELGKIAKINDVLFVEKTKQRLHTYCTNNKVLVEEKWYINGIETPSLNDILYELDTVISKQDSRFVSLMHGDFCLSNILYDFKSKSVKVIDPRGLSVTGEISIYGDIRYDVAKLAHSIIGMYDYIIGGRYLYKRNGENDVMLSFNQSKTQSEIQTYFMSLTFAGFTLPELQIYPIMILLFLSMLPLHADRPDRQDAFLANALRLYVEYKKLIS